jgi:hypothetical protein
MYSTRQYRRERDEQIKALELKIDQLVACSSYRFLTPFPDHLQDIQRLVEGVRTELWIMADCVDYGSFSTPAQHEELHKAIKRVARDKKVCILLRGEPEPISRLSPYYGRQFEEMRDTDSSFLETLNRFKSYHPGIGPISNNTEFREVLQKQHEDFARDLVKDGVQIKKLALASGTLLQVPSMFTWIKDGEEQAIYCHDFVNKNAAGWAQCTADRQFISGIMKSIWRIWDELPYVYPDLTAEAASTVRA